jgi:hypothetical protein
MKRRVAYVVETTDAPCSDCGSDGRNYDRCNIGFWFNVEWSSGTTPGLGPLGERPAFALCSCCSELAQIGQLVGPDVAPGT